jgi:outer membrane protein assembly factor BamB
MSTSRMMTFLSLFSGLLPACAGPDKDGGSDTDAPHTDAPDTDAPDTDAPDTDLASNAIGPEGGRVEVDGVVVDIPAGALRAPTSIGVEVVSAPVDLPDDRLEVTPVVRLTPHGQAFEVPVQITLPLLQPDALGVEVWTLEDEADLTWSYKLDATVEGEAVRFSVTDFCFDVGTIDTPAVDPGVPNPSGVATGYAPGSPWPASGGSEANTRRTWAAAPQTAPSLAWRWQPSISGRAQSDLTGPVIDAQGNLYVASTLDLMKLDPNGNEQWRAPLDPAAPNNPTFGTPILVSDGDVVLCRTGTLVKYDDRDGDVVWEVPGCSPIGANIDQALHVPIVLPDGTIVAPNGTLAVDLSGDVLWQAPAGLGSCHGAVVADADSNLYCTDWSTSELVSLTGTGAQRWVSHLSGYGAPYGRTAFVHGGSVGVAIHTSTFPWAIEVGLYPLEGPPDASMGDLTVPRVAGADNVTLATQRAYAVAANGDVIAVNLGTGATGGVARFGTSARVAPVWTSTTPQGQLGTTQFNYIEHARPLIDGEGAILYVGSDRQVHALEADGQLRWSVRVDPPNPGTHWVLSPVLGPDGTLYAVVDMEPAKDLVALRVP